MATVGDALLIFRQRTGKDAAMPNPLRHLLTLALLALLATAGTAQAKALPGAKISTNPQSFSQPASYPGLKHLHYEYGPIDIVPGQNTIDIGPNNLKPDVPGYITRFSPNLVYAKSH